jgi:hypothetical protein
MFPQQTNQQDGRTPIANRICHSPLPADREYRRILVQLITAGAGFFGGDAPLGRQGQYLFNLCR